MKKKLLFLNIINSILIASTIYSNALAQDKYEPYAYSSPSPYSFSYSPTPTSSPTEESYNTSYKSICSCQKNIRGPYDHARFPDEFPDKYLVTCSLVRNNIYATTVAQEKKWVSDKDYSCDDFCNNSLEKETVMEACEDSPKNRDPLYVEVPVRVPENVGYGKYPNCDDNKIHDLIKRCGNGHLEVSVDHNTANVICICPVALLDGVEVPEGYTCVAKKTETNSIIWVVEPYDPNNPPRQSTNLDGCDDGSTIVVNNPFTSCIDANSKIKILKGKNGEYPGSACVE